MKLIDNIKKVYLKNKEKLIIGLTVLLFILSVSSLYNVLYVTPTSNDECLWLDKKDANGNPYVLIDQVKVNGVTWNAGIRDGDKLLKIDNKEIKVTIDAMIILNSFKEGDRPFYTVERNGKIIEARVYVKKLINFPNLAFILLGFFWLIIGFVVIMANPFGKVHNLFYKIGATTVFLTSFGLIQRIFVSKEPFLIIIGQILLIGTTYAFLFLPFFILKFFWTYPLQFKFIEKKSVKRFLFWFPFTIGTLLAFLNIYAMFVPGNPGLVFIPRVNMVLNYFLFAAMGVGLVFLTINYYRLRTEYERKSIIIIVVTYLLGMLSIVYMVLLSQASPANIFNHPELYTPIILVAMLPVSFGISIFKYQLMDVSVVVKNTIIYFVATVSLAAIYFVFLYLFSFGISSAVGTQYQGIIAGLIFIAFAVAFQSKKDKFQEILTKRFYPEQFAYQQILLKFSNDLPGIMGLNNILKSMVEIFVENLKLKKFGVIILNDESNSIYSEDCINIDCSSIKSLMRRELLVKVIESKKQINRNVVINADEFENVFGEEGNVLKNQQIFTLVPISLKEKVLGIILLGLKSSGSQFGGKDIELLTAIANQAALSIQNAKYLEKEAKRITVERDLETARKIQQNLLPRTIPEFRGFDIYGMMIPAFQVGGDYFDVIKISENKFYIIVGDVSGKGLSASLYMTSLQSMMKIFCETYSSPKDILVAVNKKLYTTWEKSWFVTISLAMFDAENKTVTFCRAGHTPLLIKSNGTIDYLQPKGIGLGLESGTVFENSIEEVTIPVKDGAYYLFYSDGVSETMDEKNDLFGESGITDILKNVRYENARETVGMIIERLNKFKESREQYDDISLVIVKTNFLN